MHHLYVVTRATATHPVTARLIITGPCGVGKTWLACALTQAACRNGSTALYKRLPRLLEVSGEI